MSETEKLVSEGAITVAEAVEWSGIGRTVLYGLMASGKLRYVQLNNRRLIPKAELRRLLVTNIVGSNEVN